jgi:hypothetical protein
MEGNKKGRERTDGNGLDAGLEAFNHSPTNVASYHGLSAKYKTSGQQSRVEISAVKITTNGGHTLGVSSQREIRAIWSADNGTLGRWDERRSYEKVQEKR